MVEETCGGTSYTPGISHECQNKRLEKWAIHKLLIPNDLSSAAQA
jgi:hypothetical protein